MWAGCSIYVFVVVVEKLVLEGRLDTVLVVCLLYLLFLLLGTWTVSVSFEMERGFSDSIYIYILTCPLYTVTFTP